MNYEEILDILSNMHYETTIEEIKSFVDTLKIDDIREAHNKRYRYEIWDKKTDINGVSAKEIIKSKTYDIGQVYLIYIDENLVYMQDHNPDKEGYEKMTKTEAKKIAESFIKTEIEKQARYTIINLFIEKVLKGGEKDV